MKDIYMRIMLLLYRTLAIIPALALAACSPGASTAAAEQGVIAVHASFNASDFAGIYDRSDTVMKNMAPRDQFLKLMALFSERLGDYRSGKTIGWNDNYGTAGHMVTLTRSATFEKGEAQEQFLFRISDKQATLVGYHVNSDLLITDAKPNAAKSGAPAPIPAATAPQASR